MLKEENWLWYDQIMRYLNIISCAALIFIIASCNGEIIKIPRVDSANPTTNHPKRKNNPIGALGFYVTSKFKSSTSWAVDYSVQQFQVYSLDDQGNKTQVSFQCSFVASSLACFSAQVLPDAAYLIVGQSALPRKTYQRLLSLTSQHPIAGKTQPLQITEFDVDAVDYILKRLLGNPSYDFQNIFVDNNPTEPDLLGALLSDHSEKRLDGSKASFNDYMQANPTLFLFLAKAPICNSQLTFPTDGDWSQNSGDYQIFTHNNKVVLQGKASNTQFTPSDSVQYSFDNISRTSLYSGPSYVLLEQKGQDVIVYSKCNDSSDVNLTFDPGNSTATLIVQNNSLPVLVSGQKSHLRMLAVKVDSSSYSALQTACLAQTDSVEPSQLIKQFVPLMSLLASGSDQGREELADWIGRSRCLCGANFNPPLDSPNLLVGYHDNFSVSFPLGVPGIAIKISSLSPSLDQTVNTDIYGIAKFGSNLMTKGQVLDFKLGSDKVGTCTIPAAGQGSKLQTFRNGFFYNCYTGQTGDGCECAPHYVSDVTGKACVACGQNQISSNGVCQDCPANQVQVNNVCVACPVPTRYVSGSCVYCGPGSYSNDGIYCETACPNTQVVGLVSGSYACKSCPAGQIAVSYQCQACGLNQYSNNNNQCVSCAADQVVVSNACASCPAGQIAYNGTCVACARGQYVSSNQCVLCGSDKIVNNAQDGCQSCPNNQYANNYICSDCPAGEVGTTGSCSLCQPGHIALNNQCVLAAAACSFGMVPVAGVCTPCPNGTQANSLGSCSNGGEGSICAVNSDCAGSFYCQGTNNHSRAGVCTTCPTGQTNLYLNEGCTDGQVGSSCDVYSDCNVLGGLSCNMVTNQCVSAS